MLLPPRAAGKGSVTAQTGASMTAPVRPSDWHPPRPPDCPSDWPPLVAIGRTSLRTASADGTAATHDAPQEFSAADVGDTLDPEDTALLHAWIDALADSELPQSDTAMIDRIRALEELKSAAAAAQARAAAAFDASQRLAQSHAGIPSEQQIGRASCRERVF